MRQTLAQKHRKNKRQRTKKQHYVAQLYLRGFTNPSGRLFCFDKVSGTAHPTSTEAAAQESNFYEIPSGSFDGGVEVPVNTVENALGSIERMWKPLHDELIRNADAGAIPQMVRNDYSVFIVFQWMRTRTYRDTMYAVTQQSMQSLADELVAVNFPDMGEVKVVVDPKTLAAMHAQKMFDLDEMERMAIQLLQHLWLIGINNTGHSFYTSDHPVVRRGNQSFNGRPMMGIFDPGIEFVFPLDSRHILLILQRRHFASWAQHDNRSVVLSPEQVGDYNALQVMRSNQRVFCAEDDFEVAREVCKEHPEVCNPDRPTLACRRLATNRQACVRQ